MSIAKTQDDNQAAEMAEAFKPLADAAEKMNAATKQSILEKHPLPWSSDYGSEEVRDANGVLMEPESPKESDEYARAVFSVMLERVNATKGFNPAAIPALVEAAEVVLNDVIHTYDIRDADYTDDMVIRVTLSISALRRLDEALTCALPAPEAQS